MSRFSFSLFLILTLVPLTSLAARPHPLRSCSDTNEDSLVIVRGRAVCLDAAGKPSDSFLACNASSRFGFTTKEGKLYKFMSSDPMKPIFTDARVRERELQITAKLRSGDQLEIIKVQSIREGKIFDIYYYCEICSITSYTPGLCPCCRGELEFRETAP